MVIKRKKRSVKEDIALIEQGISDKLNNRFYVLDLERRCLLMEKEREALRKRLESLLLPEQVDAAKTCGISPEMYALEWIDLIKYKLRTFAPGYSNEVGTYKELMANVTSSH